MKKKYLVTDFHNKPVEYKINVRKKVEVFESNSRNNEFLIFLFTKFYRFNFCKLYLVGHFIILSCENFDEDLSKLGFESLFSSSTNRVDFIFIFDINYN